MPALQRLSLPAALLGAVLVVVSVAQSRGIGAMYLLGVALLVLGLVGIVVGPRSQRPRTDVLSRPIAIPVRGRWRGLNSPASKVPSHTHALAQTYALDITHEPVGAEPRRFDPWHRPMRRPETFPSFGQEVLSPVGGEVIAVHGTARDHLSRLSVPALAYLLVESLVRSVGAPRHLLGNHVMVRSADGTVAVLAHLQQHSPVVGVGEQVEAGRVVGRCGNSGNSSDPHVHLQLMDGPDLRTATGLPFTWTYVGENGEVREGVPADDELFTAPAPAVR